MAIAIEHTDTFGGEANYCWVRRAYIINDEKLTDLQVMRRVKKWAGISGHRCRVDDLGYGVAIYPTGFCQVIFVNYAEPEQVAHARASEIIG